MKKAICLLVGAGLLLTIGCAEQKPEEAAREIVDQQVAVHHKGFEMDTTKVVYKVVEQDDQHAMVEVSGNIAVKALIPLTKKGGEWVLAAPSAAKPAHAAAAH